MSPTVRCRRLRRKYLVARSLLGAALSDDIETEIAICQIKTKLH
jgi:hypothetical protein